MSDLLVPRDPAKPFRARVGAIDLAVVSDGLFRLDGGSMFGVVPKIIWDKKMPADARNRIDLGLNCLLIRTAGQNILVDAGMGTKWPPKFVDIYDLRPPKGRLVEGLAAEGLKPEDIHLVLFTHLHLDHTGAATRLDETGRLMPTFPNARHIVQEGELFAALQPDVRSRPSYHPENFVPLREAGLLDVIDGEKEVAPGVWTLPTPGHTAYHQSFLIESGGEKAFYFGDIMPTSNHLSPNYSMGFDLYPLEVARQRETLAERALEENWLCFWEHDPRVPAGRIVRDGASKIQTVAAEGV
jgi:glyoxylase-like metal-dependent hydrolase (beta-lactamase superfamily II)